MCLLQSMVESSSLEISEDRTRVRGKNEPEKWPLSEAVPGAAAPGAPSSPAGVTSQLTPTSPVFVPGQLHADVPEFVPGQAYNFNAAAHQRMYMWLLGAFTLLVT